MSAETQLKATPGPWTFDRRGENLVGGDGKRIIVYGAGLSIATLPDKQGEYRANAAVVQASRDLYDALVETQWSDGGMCPQCAGYKDSGHQEKCLVGLALKKARGE